MSGPLEGYADIYLSKIRRARKAHRCGACGLAIGSGERYQHVRLLYEGYWDTIRRCGRCEAIYQHLNTLIDSDMVVMERLDCGLSYREEWETDPPETIQAAVFATADEASALLEAV